MTEVNAETHLVGHYEELDNLKSDFRNYNLFHLVARLVEGETVLDIGCGIAHFLNILRLGGKKVLGIEPSAGLRTMARRINPGVRILEGFAEDADTLVDEKMDVVTMLDVLEHVEKDFEQAKKVNTILKDGGQFIIVVPAHQILFGERDKQMGHYRRYSRKMIKTLLIENGFQIKKIRHWNALGFLPYLISEKILKKPLESKLRKETGSGTLSSFMQKGLDSWFRLVENRFDFGFGLSIMVIARKAAQHEFSQR